MSSDPTRMGAFETLGLLSSADRETVERRADALSALLKLGLAPPEGDAVQLPEGAERDAEAVAEAARVLRDPTKWLEESLFWPDCRTAGAALSMAAELLEGAAGRPTEPASLVRHLALEYLSEEAAKEQALGLTITFEGCDVLPKKTFQHVFRNPWHGTKELPRRKIWMNYHVAVFRPRTKNARLIISDWEDANTPGGPAGQETAFNFVQIRPYLEE